MAIFRGLLSAGEMQGAKELHTGRPGDKAANSSPQSIERAITLHRQGKLEEAEAIYRSILEIEPSQEDAMHFLGILLHAQGKDEAALAMLQKAIVQSPRNAGLWSNLGNVLLESRDPEGAVESYQRATTIAPDFVAPYNNLGIVYRARGEYEESEAAFRRALELEPRFVAAWQNLSGLLLQVRRFDEAIKCGLRAMTLAPRDLSTLHHIGVAHLALKEYDKATAVYRSWLEKEPDNPIPRHLVAACEGRNVPARASDAYIERTFDRFAASFDAKLAQLEYRAPSLVGEAVRMACDANAVGLRILDAGCGTGLCSGYVRPLAGQLVGVDLSAGMLDQAKRTGAYALLERSELTAYLAAHPTEFDVILSADTLCYFGALEAFAAAAFGAVVPGGVLVFTVEALQAEKSGDHSLQTNGRYVHAGGYVDRVLAAAGWMLEQRQSGVLRVELGQPVVGWLVTARRPVQTSA